jgi:RsiW-degrading membrane proteinase PrsW (M82 family)
MTYHDPTSHPVQFPWQLAAWLGYVLVRRLIAWRQHPPRLDPLATGVVLGTAAAVVLAVTIVRQLPEPRVPADPRQRAEYYLKADRPDRAEEALQPWLRERLDDIEAHRLFVLTHFKARHQPIGQGDDKSDAAVRSFYTDLLAQAPSAHRRDVLGYALGFFEHMAGHDQQALARYATVGDPDLPYLSSSRGFALMGLHRDDKAVAQFRREMALGHDVPGAVRGLSHVDLAHHAWASIDSLASAPATRAHVPPDVRRTALLATGRVGGYVVALGRALTVPFAPLSMVAALFCALMWLFFVRAWDLFEREPVVLCVVTVLLGAAATRVVVAIGDGLGAWLPLLPGPGDPGLGWFVARVGLVEEVAKFIPVAIIALATRAINEPVDWMIYGCLSALGFSAYENYLYEANWGTGVALVRTFLCTPLHLSWTGALAMCALAGRRWRWAPVPAILCGLAVVAVVHGLYDFAMSSRGVAVLAMLLGVALWGEGFVALLAGAETLSPLRRRVTLGPLPPTHAYAACYAALCLIVFSADAARVEHDLAVGRLIANLTLGAVGLVLVRIYARTFARRLDQLNMLAKPAAPIPVAV